MTAYEGYKGLECYRIARELRIFLSELTTMFPENEKFMLVSQLKRSSRAITANIAEGYGRFTYSDTRNFFIIARGSVTETMEHLQTAFDENYISAEAFKQGIGQCETVFKLINGYISFLDRSKSRKS
jgi:four helix bundle protein